LLLRLGHSYCAFAYWMSRLTGGNTVTVLWNLSIFQFLSIKKCYFTLLLARRC
jgi:hypothetical protein